MSKAVLISIRKEHNDKIFSGQKKWEGRKTCPGNVEIKNYIDPTSPYNKTDEDVKFFVYEPKTGGGCGKVVGEFICDFAQTFHGMPAWKEIARALCVSVDFAFKYFNKGKGYMIRVNEPKRYDEPKSLLFRKWNNKCQYRTKDGLCSFEKEEDDEKMPCGDYICIRRDYVTRPPQSWCYVEEK